MSGSYIKGAKHDVDKGEEKAKYAPVDIGIGGFEHSVRRDDVFQYHRCQPVGESTERAGHEKQKSQTVIKNGADAFVVSFAVAACHEYLCADAESEAQHEYGNVKNAAQCRSTQFNFADAP